ncbi:protein DJ-1 homolog D-like isoform X1 [Papaver somniferum]|uniref:protein DJ-1 homolog D-like isoform X1 n=1 Tax=Papaver somniferum TaxID=3469 RepID=UPI000E6FFC63|nr:protein DJ-1 homolog D-like isoform X1 [Papaver somniferum]
MVFFPAQKSVLMICGDHMEEFEAKVAFQALEAFGLKVDAVCPGKKAGDYVHTSIFQPFVHRSFSETAGHKFTLNATFDEVEPTEYNGLLIPGGRAPEYLAGIQSVVELAKKYAQTGKPIASICHGSLILAAGDLLRGRTLTAYPSLKAVVIAAGAHWVPADSPGGYAIDGNLVSGVSYVANPKFISLFLETLGCKVSGADNKRILFLCGDFTEELELMVPFQALQALGCHVDAVCPDKKAGETCPTVIHEFHPGNQTYSGKTGYNFPLTETFEGLDSSSYDALVLPGGQAPEYLSVNEDVLTLVKGFTDARKPVGSTGHGQMILSFADALKGKKCTAHPSVKLNVVMAGGIWVEPSSLDTCYTDGNLVSGATWRGNAQFISQLMSVLGIQVSGTWDLDKTGDGVILL